MRGIFYFFITIILILLLSHYYDRYNGYELEELKFEKRRYNGIKPSIDFENKVYSDIGNDWVNRYPDEEPTKGDSITLSYSTEPKSLNPIIENSATMRYISLLLFDSLLSFDPEKLEYIPKIAKSWESYDIIYLIGENDKSNYIIARIASDSIIYSQTPSYKIEEMKARVLYKDALTNNLQIIEGPFENGWAFVKITGDKIRYLSDEKGEYIRGFDREVVWDITLREGVKFHDGHLLTEEDVIFTYYAIQNSSVDAPSKRTYVNMIVNIEKLAPMKLRFYLKEQYAWAIDIFSDIAILPKHIYAPDYNLEQVRSFESFGQYFNQHPKNELPVGTGRYKLVEYKRKKYLTLVRNDNYFLPEKRGYLKKITLEFIEDSDVAVQKLKNGEIDFIPRTRIETFVVNLDPEKDENIRKNYVKIPYYIDSYSYICFNMRKFQLEDKRVRQAFSHLLPIQNAIIDQWYYGLGMRITGPQNFFGPAYDKTILPLEYDFSKAKELLSSAGWFDTDGDGILDKDGIPFKISFDILPSKSYRRLGNFFKENLKKAGIEVQIRQFEWATYLENISDRQFDTYCLSWSSIGLESDPIALWHSKEMENRGSNSSGFHLSGKIVEKFTDGKFDDTDKLIEAIRREVNPEKRSKLFHQLHRIIHDTQPYIFLYIGPEAACYHKRFRGVKFFRLNPAYDIGEWWVPLKFQKSYKGE